MARSIPVIYTQLLQQKNAQAGLNNLNSPSQVSIWNLWLWITAVGQNLFEQLCDLFTSNIETQIANAPVFTPQWIVQMCKLYQYSASSPQILQLSTGTTYPYVTIGYPIVNSSICPVTQAAVTSNADHELIIKVTGANGPLDGSPGIIGPVCSGLISYLNEILTPDTQYQLINEDPDQLFIQAVVYYNASYSGVIQINVQAAITNYLSGIPFNGIVTVSSLEEAILAVSGVSDVILNNVFWRVATDPAPTGGSAPTLPPTNELNQLVSNNKVISRNYQTVAGYVVPETTPGYTPGKYFTYYVA